MASSSLFPHDSGDSFRCSAAGCSITPTPGVMVLKGPSAGTCSIFGLPIAGCSPTLNSEYVGSLRRLISSYVRCISSGHHTHLTETDELPPTHLPTQRLLLRHAQVCEQ